MKKDWIQIVAKRDAGTLLGEDMYAGLDEVGVSSIAGAMVCSIVILPKEHGLERLPIDSKLLHEDSITILASEIQDKALYYAIYSIKAQDVDNQVSKIGMLPLHKLMWEKAIKDFRKDYPEVKVILDGKHGIDMPNVEPIVGADNQYDNVSASAILAKYWCDKEIREYGETYPGYQLEKHKGYPTSDHLEAIRKLGLTSFHRENMAKEALKTQKVLTPYPLDELESNLRKAGKYLSMNKTLANEGSIVFLREMWVKVIQNKKLPSLKQQHFLMSACKQVIKNEKRLHNKKPSLN